MQIKEENNRFALYNDENQEINEMIWSDVSESVIVIDHMFVDPTYRGQKLAEKLVLTGAEKAGKEYKKVIPLCPLTKKEFDTKPEYGDVLRR